MTDMCATRTTYMNLTPIERGQLTIPHFLQASCSEQLFMPVNCEVFITQSNLSSYCIRYDIFNGLSLENTVQNYSTYKLRSITLDEAFSTSLFLLNLDAKVKIKNGKESR